MIKAICIKTTRYSAFFKSLLAEYPQGVSIRIDEKEYSSSDIPVLLEAWCTNERIKKTRDFILSRGNEDLFGFHDHPDNLWAAYSELPFVERMHQEHVIRYEICDWQEPIFTRLRKWLLSKITG